MRIYVKHLMNRCSLSFVVIHARLRYYFALERLQRTQICRVFNHCCVDIIYAGIFPHLSRFSLENKAFISQLCFTSKSAW